MGSKKSPEAHREAFRATALFQSGLSGFVDALLSSTRLVLFGVDGQERFTAVSAGWERILGYSAAELLERSVRDFLQEAEAWDGFWQTLQKGDEPAASLTFVSKDGRSVLCEVAAAPWLGSDKRLLGYAVFARDVSDWEKFQNDLVRVDRLAEMGRMSAGVVHDLKNPLSIIDQAAGWAEAIVEDAEALGEDNRSELRQALQEIGQQTKRCRRITNQILDFVREAKPKKVDFDIKAFLRETVRYLQPEISTWPIEVACTFEESSPLLVRTDSRLLQQVFVNLLSNAIDAVKEKEQEAGRIALSLDVVKDDVLVTIADNGPGMPEDVQEKAFDLFYTTKPEGEGTGLGLPICRSIMRRLGGELHLESCPGFGTTFTVRIPSKRSA